MAGSERNSEEDAGDGCQHRRLDELDDHVGVWIEGSTEQQEGFGNDIKKF